MFWINFKADVDIIDCETKQNPPRETKYCVTNILIICPGLSLSLSQPASPLSVGRLRSVRQHVPHLLRLSARLPGPDGVCGLPPAPPSPRHHHQGDPARRPGVPHRVQGVRPRDVGRQPEVPGGWLPGRGGAVSRPE